MCRQPSARPGVTAPMRALALVLIVAALVGAVAAAHPVEAQRVTREVAIDHVGIAVVCDLARRARLLDLPADPAVPDRPRASRARAPAAFVVAASPTQGHCAAEDEERGEGSASVHDGSVALDGSR